MYTQLLSHENVINNNNKLLSMYRSIENCSGVVYKYTEINLSHFNELTLIISYGQIYILRLQNEHTIITTQTIEPLREIVNRSLFSWSLTAPMIDLVTSTSGE